MTAAGELEAVGEVEVGELEAAGLLSEGAAEGTLLVHAASPATAATAAARARRCFIDTPFLFR